MKRILYIISMILVFSCLASLMVGCKKDKNDNLPEEPVYGDYTVTVVDGLNNPLSNLVVKFTYPDGTTKSRITETDGVATIKNVELGDYKVTVEKGFSNAVIDVAAYDLTKEKTTLKLVFPDESKSMEIYGALESTTYAAIISATEYSVPCFGGETSYFVFNASQKGIYKVSVADTSDDVTVSYLGIPMYVQDHHCGDGEYDGKTFELVIQDPRSPYVIGVRSGSDKDVALKIERVGDAPFDPQYEEWTMMEKTSDVGKCDIPDETVLVNFDITDASFSVVERDGVYYTADGRPVYIRITSGNAAYLGGASLALIAGFVDDKIGMNIGGYVYDENGSFLEKRNYNLLIEDYMELCDGGYGVVPLTTELAECIKLHGESNHWWNSTSPNYIFGEVDEITENAWLFLCMIESK